jgi:hypothetical protein
MHTNNLLADELTKVGLTEMAAKARTGYYHDFLSPLEMPEIQLVSDLAQASVQNGVDRTAILALRERVINGDFDATKEESDEWAASPEGRAAFKRLAGEGSDGR